MFTRSIRFALTLLIVGLSMVGAQPAAAQSTTADVVYGQLGSFTTNTANNGGISANSLGDPIGSALDSSGNLYVVDANNSRVLFYPSGSTTATQVYGQGGSFTTNTQNKGGISANSLDFPTGVALDSSGNLYVTDSLNNRVLFYPSGSTTATRVYGQGGSFTTNTANKGGISANSLFIPAGVALDSNGNLYVVDEDNNRVLFYPSGSTTATKVYGQGGSFTTNAANKGGISANSLYDPTGVALDSSGNLYVADEDNNRVLFYPSGSTTATKVYGQGGSFTSNAANEGGISANSLYDPSGVALDSSGNLYVADYGNNRVLFYPSGSTTATRVYGQLGSFTTNTANEGGISANSLDVPLGVALDSSGNLYVADTYNNRVLIYPPTTTPGIYSPANQSALAGNSVTFWWAGYPGASNYWLDIGSSYGGNNYLQSGPLPGSQYSLTANNLPNNGSTIYVTWWYEIGGSWSYIEYQYTAYGGLGIITSPSNSSTLSGSSQLFQWTAGADASAYWLTAGNSQGGNNYYNSGNLGNVLMVIATGLPTNGSMVYVTLFTEVNGQWFYNQYTYTAFSPTTGLAVMQSPTPGTEIDGTQATFTWSAGMNAQNYWLDIGDSEYGNDIYQSGPLGIGTLSTTVSDLPNNGEMIYATLWTEINGQWYYNEYQYQSGPNGCRLLYENGPVNGTVNAWGIDGGYSVADSFVPNNSTLNTFDFYVWQNPGDQMLSVQWSVTDSPLGGTVYGSGTVASPNLTDTFLFTNGYGYNIDKISASGLNVGLISGGTYYLNLQNATMASGNPVYWDQNSGIGCQSAGCPSQAFQSTFGSIPSEAFDVCMSPVQPRFSTPNRHLR